MKILLTGFDPFGGEAINPAYEAVRALPERIGEAELITLKIPTAFSRSIKVVDEVIRQYRPDVVLCIGQSGGRSQICLEKVAINLAEARIPDNDGAQPIDQPLQKEGPDAYFATIPVKAVVERLKAEGIPAAVSYTAGTYVCNSLMYQVLHLADLHYPSMRAGFIHVPFAMEQAVRQPAGTPFMALDDMTRAIRIAVETLTVTREDVKTNTGTIM